MRRSTALSLVLACCLAVPSSTFAMDDHSRVPSAASSATLPVVEIPHETIVLPNGLTLIVHEDHSLPVVSVGVWYHVGSANETEGRTGFAHLFEHLMFNGSKHANTDWFVSMNAVGATGMNGSTGNDRTNYYQTVPTGALDRVLWLESDRMGHLLPVIDEARLEEQRRVVQNEKRQLENSPLGALPAMIYAAIYPVGHPYSWTPIGSMEDLEAASVDDVSAFFNRWYGPSNAVLVLSGDITVAEAREKVERYFGDIPSGPPLSRPRELVAKRTGESRGELEADVANPMLTMVWNAPGWAAGDTTLLELAASALGQGANSHLHKRLVRELELSTGVSVSLDKLELGSQFTVQATARPGVSLQALEAAVKAEMAAFLSNGISDEDLERIRFGYYSASVRGASSTMSKASLLADGQLYAGSADYYRQRLQTLYTASQDDVLGAARRWLSDGAYIVEVTPRPALTVNPVKIDRTAPPPLGDAAPFSLPPLQRAVLSNGIEVALAERHDVPTVSVQMIFKVGALPDGNPASVGAATALAMATSGTSDMTALEISARREALGAMLGWTNSFDYSRYGLSALTLKLPESLDLWVKILKDPVFPESEWERTRTNFAANYEENKQTPQGQMGLISPQLYYGAGHPYALAMTPEIAARLTTEDFRHFYETWIRPDLATLLIVGDTTLAEIVPMLESRLGDWRAVDGPAPTRASIPPASFAPGVRVVLLDQPGAESSLILVGRPAPARNDPDHDVLELANTVLGGGFVSRLNMNLREDKGWSYGARSAVDSGPFLGRVSAGTAVQWDRTADSIREINREIREFGTTRPPTAAEIETARNELLLGMPATLQGNGGALNMYRSVFENNLPDDYWNTYVPHMQALTVEQVQAAAGRLFDPSNVTWIVIGDLSRIEADVRALNLGRVEVMDADGTVLR